MGAQPTRWLEGQCKGASGRQRRRPWRRRRWRRRRRWLATRAGAPLPLRVLSALPAQPSLAVSSGAAAPVAPAQRAAARTRRPGGGGGGGAARGGSDGAGGASRRRARADALNTLAGGGPGSVRDAACARYGAAALVGAAHVTAGGVQVCVCVFQYNFAFGVEHNFSPPLRRRRHKYAPLVVAWGCRCGARGARARRRGQQAPRAAAAQVRHGEEYRTAVQGVRHAHYG